MMQAAHAVTPVEKALAESKIMPKGYAFRVTDRDAEATVQTYQSTKSPTANDMKIDSVLIAKVVTDKLPRVAKVNVQFYKPNRSGYSQVLVTVGDITAYGLGGISKDKLLQSLEVRTVATADLSPEEKSAYSPFKAGNVKFAYPSNWRWEPMTSDGYIARFSIPGSQNWANMLLRKQTAHSAEEQAGFDETWAKTHSGKVMRKTAVAVGQEKMTGYELLVQKPDPDHPNTAPWRYDHHVYFGNADIYSLSLDCPVNDAKKYGLTFAKILNSVEIEK